MVKDRIIILKFEKGMFPTKYIIFDNAMLTGVEKQRCEASE